MDKNVLISFTVPNGIDFWSTPAGDSFTSIKDKYRWKIVQGHATTMARNKAITQNQAVHQNEFDFDTIVFVDHDVIFTEETLQYIIEKSKEYKLIGLACYAKRSEREIVAGNWCNDIEGYTENYSSNIDTICECEWMSLGFTAIDREIFSNMEFPYFRQLLISWDNCQDITSEDVYFCIEAKKVGYIPYIDCSTKLKHINYTLTKGQEMAEQKKETKIVDPGASFERFNDNVYAIQKEYQALLKSYKIVIDVMKTLENRITELEKERKDDNGDKK